MSNVVNVKVCLINENNEELLVRRFDLHLAHLSNYTDFAVKLCEFFPELTGKTFKIFWKDEENDNVVISSSEEIQTAVKQMKSNFKKFYVKMTTTQMKEQNDDTIHPDIVCDGCDCCVIGYRYKCLGCKNYDLCSKCEQAGVHSEHLMLRIPYPFILSRNDLHCISALFPVNCETKHSRHSKRHSHSHSKSHKKRRCDKHDSGPETGEESDEKHHKKHFNRRCAYSQMMNDFFKPFADPAQSDAEKTSEAKSGETKTQKPRVELTLDTVRSIMRSISSLLDPFEIDVGFNVQPGAEAEEKQKEQMQKAEKKEQTETSTATPSAPSVAKEVRFATTEKDSESLAQEIEKITEALASQKMNQTAANDDWVSFEELASEEPQTSTSTREASKTSKTEESTSQTETATNKARNLYPTLNSEQQNSEDPVSNALKKMLDMGFTNENDWLSRLLQAKNGDIEQALEVLTAYGK